VVSHRNAESLADGRGPVALRISRGSASCTTCRFGVAGSPTIGCGSLVPSGVSHPRGHRSRKEVTPLRATGGQSAREAPESHERPFECARPVDGTTPRARESRRYAPEHARLGRRRLGHGRESDGYGRESTRPARENDGLATVSSRLVTVTRGHVTVSLQGLRNARCLRIHDRHGRLRVRLPYHPMANTSDERKPTESQSPDLGLHSGYVGIVVGVAGGVALMIGSYYVATIPPTLRRVLLSTCGDITIASIVWVARLMLTKRLGPVSVLLLLRNCSPLIIIVLMVNVWVIARLPEPSDTSAASAVDLTMTEAGASDVRTSDGQLSIDLTHYGSELRLRNYGPSPIRILGVRLRNLIPDLDGASYDADLLYPFNGHLDRWLAIDVSKIDRWFADFPELSGRQYFVDLDIDDASGHAYTAKYKATVTVTNGSIKYRLLLSDIVDRMLPDAAID
jgi:hypothetical protein